jgi:hypothetical protein
MLLVFKFYGCLVESPPSIDTHETIFTSVSQAEHLFVECGVGNCLLSGEYYTHWMFLNLFVLPSSGTIIL